MPKLEVHVYANRELYDRVEAYAEEHGLSNSAAWKELAQKALPAEEEDDGGE